MKSIKEKIKIIKEIDSGRNKKKVAEEFGIGLSTLNKILNFLEREQFNTDVKRQRDPVYKNVDSATIAWFLQMREQNVAINGNIIKKKALKFAEELNQPKFIASEGWLTNFKAIKNLG